MNDVAPVFDEHEPSIQVRDRALPHVAFHQGENLFDRKKHFVQKAAFKLNIKKPAPMTVKVRDISERRVGTTTKSIIGKLADAMIGKTAQVPTGEEGSPFPAAQQKRGRGRPPKVTSTVGKPNGVHETIKKSAQENASAAAAESLAA
jgi:hypothetical protein